MTFKAVIVDFGEVLNAPVDVERNAARREKLAGKINLQANELWPYLFESEASILWMTGQLDWDGFWKASLEPRGMTDSEEIRLFADELFEDDGILNPEMIEILNQLKGKYKLAILSNASRTEAEMKRMLREDFGLPRDLFDVVVSSTSFGATKPDPSIFKEVLRRLDVIPEEAVFTDDMVNFTAAASDLGILSHTFTTPALFRVFLEENGLLP
jgi:HAD superfamily hydrolase (TIGR01509 family)